MASAGNITWDLIANSSKFVSELDKANKAGKNWGDKLGKAAKGVATTFAAAGAAADAGLAALYTVTASNIDEQAKFADKIGVSTDALAGLQHAGDLTGVSTETMNQGLQRMTRRVAEAAQGTGVAVDALDRLNLSAEDLNQLSPDEQFLAIADAMGDVESRSDQVALAFKLFDSGGVALLNTMDMASDGIRDAMEQAEHLGIALNRIDAAQVENANDAFDNMTKVSSGISRQLTVAFAPAVEAVSTKMLELALETEWVGDIGTTVFNAVVKGAGYAADAVYGITLYNMGLRAGFLELAAVAAESMSDSANTVAKVLNATVGNVGKLIKWITDQLSSVFAMGEKLPGQAGKLARSISGELEKVGKKLNEKLQFDEQGVIEGIDAIREAADEASKDFENIANQELPSDKINKMVGEWQDVSRETAEAAANAKVYNEIISDTTPITTMASAVSNNTATMERAFESWGNSFTNTMADIVTRGEIDFSRLAESIINDLIRIAIQANITDQFLNALGFGSRGSGGGSSPEGMSIGGPVERGTTYLVGEHGPELFTASNSGRIVPNEKLGSGGQTTVNVYTQPGESADVNTRTTPEGDIIEVFMKQVDSRINEQVSRGQGLARTLEGRYGLSRRAM